MSKRSLSLLNSGRPFVVPPRRGMRPYICDCGLILWGGGPGSCDCTRSSSAASRSLAEATAQSSQQSFAEMSDGDSDDEDSDCSPCHGQHSSEPEPEPSPLPASRSKSSPAPHGALTFFMNNQQASWDADAASTADAEADDNKSTADAASTADAGTASDGKSDDTDSDAADADDEDPDEVGTVHELASAGPLRENGADSHGHAYGGHHMQTLDTLCVCGCGRPWDGSRHWTFVPLDMLTMEETLADGAGYVAVASMRSTVRWQSEASRARASAAGNASTAQRTG